MITTISQAHAAIAAIDSKPRLSHDDVVRRDQLIAALDQVRQYKSWRDMIAHHDASQNVTMRDQESRSLEEWVAICMSPLAKRLAGRA